MESYKDSVTPPLISDFAPLQGIFISGKGSSGRKESSPTDSILQERGRREKNRENYSALHSMVPSLFTISKPTREKILYDTVGYIKCLEEEIKRLEGIKKLQVQEQEQEQEVAKQVSSRFTNSKSALDVTVSSGATFFAIQLPFKSGIITKIVKVFDKHHAEVLEATVSVDEQQLLTFTVTIVLAIDGGNTIQKIKAEIVAL